MSGLTYSDQSSRAGLVYIAAGNGSSRDWAVHKGRKERRCGHQGPHNWRLDFPCEHPVIASGEWYVETRQSLFESDSLSVACAIRANVYRVAQPNPAQEA